MLRSLFDGKSFRLTALLAVVAISASCGGDEGPIDPEDNGDPIPGLVSGSVVDGSGNGVADAVLELSQGSDSFTETSTSDGSYLFNGVPAGSWTLSVTPPNGFEIAAGEPSSQTVTVEEDATTTADNFVLASVAPPADSGTVDVLVRANGSPESGVAVKATVVGTGSPAATGTTDANGMVSFELGVEDYEIEITVPSGLALDAGETNPKNVTVTADATTDVTFDLVTATADVDTVTIQLNSFSFSDTEVTINSGDAIRWVNATNTLHSITPEGHNEWANQTMNTQGEEFIHTFNDAGEFPYRCTYHFVTYGMAGTIIVQ